MPDPVKNAQFDYDALMRSMIGVASASLKTSNAIKEHNETIRSHAEQLKKAGFSERAIVRELLKKENQIRSNITAIINYTKEQKSLQRVMNEVEKEIENASEGFRKYTGMVSTAGRVLGTAIGIGSRYTRILGAHQMGLDGMVDSLKRYNQSMFTLKRAQQVAGNGTDDIDKALKSVKNSTVLSQNEFLDLATSINQTYVGMLPTTKSLADFASSIQSKFGPSIDVIKNKFSDLMGIQSQFPAMYDRILEANEALTKGDTNRADAIRTGVIAQMQALGMSSGLQRTVLQYTIEQTKEQEKQIKTNESLAKVAQTSQDAQLAMAQSVEGAMRTAADAATLLYKSIEKFSKLSSGLMAAGGLLNAIASIASVGKGSALFGALGKAASFAGTKMLLSGGAAPVGGAAATGGVGLGGLAFSAAGIGAVAYGSYEIAKAAKEREKAGEEEIATTGEMAVSQRDIWNKVRKEKAMGVERYGEEFTKKFEEKLPDIQRVAAKKDDPLGVANAYRKAMVQIREEMDKMSGFKPIEERGIVELEKDLKKAKQETKREEEKKSKITKGTNVSQKESLKIEEEYNRAKSNELAISSALLLKYNATVQNLNNQLSFIEKISQSYSELIGITEKVGVANQDLADSSARQATKELEAVKNSAKKASKPVLVVLEGILKDVPGVELDIKPSEEGENILSWYINAEKKLNDILKDQSITQEKRTDIEGSLQLIIGQRTNIETKSQSLREAEIKRATYYNDVNIKANETYMRNLEATRNLTQQLKLGWAADAQAMQDIIDLNLQNIGLFEEQRESLVKQMETSYGLIDADVERIKNSKSNLETYEIILQRLKESGKVQVDENGNIKEGAELLKDVNSKALEWFDRTTRIKEAHSKILEVTKDLREGYLSVFTEMASNAKEFEKIIGGVNHGYTQILHSQEKVWGKGQSIGTMTAGALVPMREEDTGKLTPSYRARMQPAARYTPQGLVTLPSDLYMAQMENIKGRGTRRESLKEQMEKGTLYSSTFKDYRATIATSPLAEEYHLGAMAEANAIDGSKTLQGIEKNTRAIQENTEGVHPAIMAAGAKTTREITDSERHARELESVIALPSERVQVGSFGEKVRAKQEEAIKKTQIEINREARRTETEQFYKDNPSFQIERERRSEEDDRRMGRYYYEKNNSMAMSALDNGVDNKEVRVQLSITAAPGLSDIISITQESKVGLTSNKSAVHGSTNFYVT